MAVSLSYAMRNCSRASTRRFSRGAAEGAGRQLVVVVSIEFRYRQPLRLRRKFQSVGLHDRCGHRSGLPL